MSAPIWVTACSGSMRWNTCFSRMRAPAPAAVMKMSAAEAYGMGIVDDVLSEGPAPAHENPDAAVDVVRDYVRRELAELSSVPADDLVEQRRARFEAF